MCCDAPAMTPAPLIFPTPCQCTDPGWCARHKCHKDRVQFEHCRRLMGWFQRWERGEGTGSDLQNRPVLHVACRHRGSELRRERCSSCKGHVELKIFACEIHNECTLAANVVNVRVCQTCGDYQPQGSPPESEGDQ